MIIDNVMYNNLDDIIKTPQGLRLLRYPQKVIDRLNPGARLMARYACNIEIRFVTEAPLSFVSILSESGDGDATIYYGDYVVDKVRLPKGEITKLTLSVPASITGLEDDFYKNNLYKLGVWRIHLHGSIMTVCDIDTQGYMIRTPNADEMPNRTMLSYGSSISHGSGSHYSPLTYVNTLSKLLRVNCLAKGTGGSCFAEKEVADDFSSRTDWDFALLEVGVNMIGAFDKEEFKKRFTYLADKMYKTGKKLIFVTIYPFSEFYKLNNGEISADYKKALEFNEIIRKKCNEFDKDRVLLVEGNKVLTTTEMLSFDGIHPSTEGHIMMGYNLYNQVKEFIG